MATIDECIEFALKGTESAEVATSARTCNLHVHDGGDKNVFETLLDVYVYVV